MTKKLIVMEKTSKMIMMRIDHWCPNLHQSVIDYLILRTKYCDHSESRVRSKMTKDSLGLCWIKQKTTTMTRTLAHSLNKKKATHISSKHLGITFRVRVPMKRRTILWMRKSTWNSWKRKGNRSDSQTWKGRISSKRRGDTLFSIQLIQTIPELPWNSSHVSL